MEANENRHSQLEAFRGMDVTWLLDQWVERQPDKTFVVWAPFDGAVRRWSYAEGDPEIARHWRPLPVAYALEQQLDGDVMDWGIRPPGRLACNTVSCVMPKKI